MARLILVLIVLALVAVLGAGVVLSTLDIDPPGGAIERVIPDERFRDR
jgi:hypothetical protein